MKNVTQMDKTDSAELLRLIEKRQAELAATESFNPTNKSISEWEPPIPFDNGTVPPFPVDCLPEPLKEFAIALSEDKQVPIDMPAVEMLAVMSLCVQGKYKVKIKPGWIVPLNLYCLMIAESGEKKSPVLRAVVNPINQYEREYNEKNKEEISRNKKEKEMLYRELDDLTNRAIKTNSKSPVSKEDVFTKQNEIDNFQEMKKLRLLADDVTPEAFTTLLAKNDGIISIISAEGGLFDTLSGRFTDTPYIDPILKTHDGDYIRVDRKSREEEDIPNPCATILLTVQPDVINNLINNQTFRGRGLPARFLYSKPVSLRGSRRYITKEVPEDLTQKYKELCYDLLSVKKPEKAVLLELSDGAKQLSENFFYELESQLKDELEPISDFASKLQGNIARIAGILHLVDNYNFIFRKDLPISRETMQNAITIGYYFLNHAIVAFSQAGADKKMQEAKYILEKLKSRNLVKANKRNIIRICRKFCKVDELAEPLKILIEHGYLRECTQTYNGIGKRPDITYMLNPAVIENK